MLKRRSFAIASLFLAFGALAAACSSSPSSSSSNTTTSTTGAAAATTTTTASPSGPKTTFGSGSFSVNTDIAPGTYVSTGGSFCYWERLKGTSGQFDDIIANETTSSGQSLVTIAPTDVAFKSSGCAEWKAAPTSGTPKNSFGNGIWAVGIDIAPGTYKATGGSTCYWARLSGFGGTFDELITNGTGEGAQLVTIAPTDKGFKSSGCGEWKAS